MNSVLNFSFIYNYILECSSVLSKLIQSSPAEGPEEDFKSSTDMSFTDSDIEATKPLMSGLGDENEADAFSLCTSCLVDKCGAHHCNRCQSCVVDMNYHCSVTMNCVGSGNGRIHFAFATLVFSICVVFFILTLSVEHTVYCPDSRGIIRNFFAAQFCVFRENPALALTPLVLIFIANYALQKVMMMTTCIALETTELDMSRRRNRLKSLQRISTSEMILKVMNFCMTGTYPLSRRSMREVELEEKRLAEEQAKLDAEKASLREKHKSRRAYREGSFDNTDSPNAKSNPLEAVSVSSRIDR